MDVLIVKIGAIGDVIMALPMVETLLQQDKATRITWLCGKTVEPLLRKVEGVHQLITIDEAKLFKGSTLDKIATIIRVWMKLCGRRFDLIVIGHSDLRYQILTLTACGRECRSFTRKPRMWPVPGRHHSDEYSRLASLSEGPTVIVKQQYLTSNLPESLSKILCTAGNSNKVAIAPGGAKNILHDDALRRWPIEYYVELTEMLLAKNVKVILTGGSTDEWVIPHFREQKVINLIGQTSLTDIIAVYRQCNAVVAHDSGLLHLAGLAGVPIVALFGPTNPHEKVPRYPNVQIFWGGHNLACRPCYDGKTYARCSKQSCLCAITPEQVHASLMNIMGIPNV